MNNEQQIAFDIGACTGESLDKFRDYDIVFAFEPILPTYNKLLENSLKYPNVKTYNIAIADINGESPINLYFYKMLSSFLKIDPDGEFTKVCEEKMAIPPDELKFMEMPYLSKLSYSNSLDEARWYTHFYFHMIKERPIVKTMRLDTFMNENNINHVDFIKIDTQGYDLKVVKSLGNMIKNVKKIELEVQLKSLYIGSPSKEEIVNFMAEHNFKLIEKKYDYHEKYHENYRIGYEQDLIFENEF